MMASSLWLLTALVLAGEGHPLTAALIALPWFAHRRWERQVIRMSAARTKKGNYILHSLTPVTKSARVSDAQEASPPPPAVTDLCLGKEFTDFYVEHGRVPMIHDARKPWTYRGWLMWYRLQCESHPQVSPRWEYWTRTMIAGRILDEAIPQIAFSDHASDKSEGYKMLDRCMNILSNYSSAPTSYLMEWLKFGLSLSKDEPIELPVSLNKVRASSRKDWR